MAEETGAATDFAIKQKMKDEFVGWRATFLRRDRERNNLVHDQNTQALGVIDMTQVDKSEGGVPADIDCSIWKSNLPVPKPVRFKNASLSPFTFVGAVDRHTPFTYLQPEAALFLNYNAYTAKDPRFTYRDGHLYVYAKTAKKIFVRGVFEDPRDVEAFNGCTGVTPYSDDKEFPIAEDLVNLIKEKMYSRLLQTRPDDTTEVEVNED